MVTVTSPENPYLADAPFDALEFKAEGFSCVLPDWDYETLRADDYKYSEKYYPENAPIGSYIQIEVEDVGEVHDYNTYREFLYGGFSIDFFQNTYKNSLGDLVFEIKDFQNSDFKTDLITGFKSEHTLICSGLTSEYVQYTFPFKNYLITIMSIDMDSLDLETVAEYMVNSFINLQ